MQILIKKGPSNEIPTVFPSAGKCIKETDKTIV